MTDVHSCSYYCDRPECIKAQRDELRERLAQPEREPLTDEEIEDIWADCSVDWDDTINVLTLARAIEAAHGIKGEA